MEFDNLNVHIAPDKFTITDSASGIDIKDFDLVIVREYTGFYLDLAFVVSKYFELNNVKYFNNIYLRYRPVSKLAQAAIFYELKLPFPETSFSIKPNLLAGLADSVGFPLILKAAQASHGDNNFLVKSSEELGRLLTSNPGVKFVAQKYIPNDGDYRLLLINRQPGLQILRRAQDGSHLNNTSKGGLASVVADLPNAALEGARKLVEHMDVDLAGVDILLDADKNPYFLEINFQPQIISGALVEEKLVKIKQLFDNQLGEAAGE